jgi:hypothetical protein
VAKFSSNTGICKVLLFGYNRPDLLKDRLEELIRAKPLDLFVSIDWHSPEQTKIFEEMLNEYAKVWPPNLLFEFKLHMK